jgi:membrane protein implicated in regulation of membrane protease activity
MAFLLHGHLPLYGVIFVWIYLIFFPLSFIFFIIYAVVSINNVINFSAKELTDEIQEHNKGQTDLIQGDLNTSNGK